MENVLTTIWLVILWVAVATALFDFALVWLSEIERKHKLGVQFILGQWTALFLVGLILSIVLPA